MRRPLVLGGALVVAGAAAALLFLGRASSGPFPSAERLREHGFAAWPVDTVAEAEEECAGAEAWRLDASATAARFARDVLGYPEPHAGDHSGTNENHARLLIGTGGVPDLFLGSVLEVDRYGHCWYVTEGAPREDEVTATLGFVYRKGRTHLLLGHHLGLPHVSVGWGGWETEIHAGLRQSVMPLPDLDDDATGHVIYTHPDETGISESVGARSLGHVPPPPSGPPARLLAADDVVDDRSTCRLGSSHRKPEAALRYLFRWTFPELLEQRKGFPSYERKDARHLGGDRWRLFVDDAVLDARIPEVAGRCYTILSMVPVDRDPPLRRLWIGDRGVTFGVDWGGGDEATVAFGSDSGGAGGTLKQIREPVTFATTPGAGPGYARVVLYKDGHVVSAWIGLYSMEPR